MDTSIQPNKTYVIVMDLQGDFTTHHEGSLAVEGTDQSYMVLPRTIV
jgi:nicotinamidase-related amidase